MLHSVKLEIIVEVKISMKYWIKIIEVDSWLSGYFKILSLFYENT